MAAPQAACVLVIHPEKLGHVLAVSRGGDRSAWGLPGGSIEPGETPKIAAAREMFEETGLVLNPIETVKLYSGPSQNKTTGETRTATTYAVLGWSGRLRSSREGYAEWRPWKDVARGPFGEYNAEVARAWKKFINI